jgi:hypothetical protein
MKIFLSWSGPHSRAIAEALNDWLDRVIQAVKPFYSPEIEKGAKWSNEIDAALEGTSFGVICLTPDNLNSPWIHFEAGALSKTEDAIVCTFLYGLTAGDVPPPLGKFQHTVAEKPDTLKLLKTINARLAKGGADPLKDGLLEENLNLFWPQLQAKLDDAAKRFAKGSERAEKEPKSTRNERAILGEILELARSQERRLTALEAQTKPASVQSVPVQSVKEPRRTPKYILWPGISMVVPAGLSDRLVDALTSTLPGSEIRVVSGVVRGTEEEMAVTVRFKEPLPEDTIDLRVGWAADAAGITQPSYSLFSSM